MDEPVPRASGPHPIQTERGHSGWRSRGYLPHFDSPGTVQHVVFRLADAVPAALMKRLGGVPAAERLDTVAAFLRRSHGEALLSNPLIAILVEDALLHFDGDRCRMLARCVMPTHVHALFEQTQGHALSSLVHSWKSFTASRANRLLGRGGAFWAPEYYDRFMRDERHLEATRSYIESNPVMAGLCGDATAWRFSSAWSSHGA